MLDSVTAVLDYTAGMNYEAFLNDRKTRDAVIRNLQVLGEAGNRISKTIRDRYPEIEWMRSDPGISWFMIIQALTMR